jgi:Family of unknown function (DUF6510)
MQRSPRVALPPPWDWAWPALGGMWALAVRCEQVLVRLVRGPGRAWLDLRGLTYLQLPLPDQT